MNVTAGAAQTGTIQDDDANTPTASIADVSIAEGNSGETLLVFTVTLDQANTAAWKFRPPTCWPRPVLITPATTKPIVTIAKDTTSQTVTVKLNGDTVIEKDETFRLSITKIDGTSIGDGEAIGTIVNDDTATASIDSVTLPQKRWTTNFDFTVTIDKTAAFDVDIPWTFSNVTTNDADFGRV